MDASAGRCGFHERKDLIEKICENYGVLLIEAVADTIGVTIRSKQCGSFGNSSAISDNGNENNYWFCLRLLTRK